MSHSNRDKDKNQKVCRQERERERQTERLAEMRARDKHTQEMPRKDRDGQNTHLNPFIQGTGSIHSNEVIKKPVLWEIIILWFNKLFWRLWCATLALSTQSGA